MKRTPPTHMSVVLTFFIVQIGSICTWLLWPEPSGMRSLHGNSYIAAKTASGLHLVELMMLLIIGESAALMYLSLRKVRRLQARRPLPTSSSI